MRRHHELARRNAVRERLVRELDVDVEPVDGQLDRIRVAHLQPHLELLLEDRSFDRPQADERHFRRLEIRRHGRATGKRQAAQQAHRMAFIRTDLA